MSLLCTDADGGGQGSVSWEVSVEEEEEERRCVRCRKSFYMLKSGAYASYETCSYHWGKLRYQGVSYIFFTVLQWGKKPW
jgi:hypothetical protein